MLTTINNPFDPFTRFDEWRAFDTANRTDCCGYIARMVTQLYGNKPFYDDDAEAEAVQVAINRIVDLTPTVYCKVYEGDKRYTLPPAEFEAFANSLMQ